jgi:hypothetical protein
MLKHRPYSVAIRFKGMSSYYDHVFKIKELNYKEGWKRGVMHVFGSYNNI